MNIDNSIENILEHFRQQGYSEAEAYRHTATVVREVTQTMREKREKEGEGSNV